MTATTRLTDSKFKPRFELPVYGGDYFFSANGVSRQCREQFAHDIDSTTKYFFYSFSKQARIPSFIKLMEEIETYLNFPEDYKTTFETTTSPSFLKINVNSWWMNNRLRRDFFTAILKSVAVHKAGNKNIEELEDILNSDSIYFNSPALKRAFNRFLKGYTVYRKNCSGWVMDLNNDSNLINMTKGKDNPKNDVVNVVV
jgi:hypothetical protein